ncbi:hypothetical protein PR048_033061 [Dryococelus australis]|uniref:Uncharacterized protein n=1 Tax=Dryococelus australis TaxID=614101 RepID=A0ABQ9G201_9NEOP|nr:hypothetical protein PR048_033061 [Dryococelus australis]
MADSSRGSPSYCKQSTIDPVPVGLSESLSLIRVAGRQDELLVDSDVTSLEIRQFAERSMSKAKDPSTFLHRRPLYRLVDLEQCSTFKVELRRSDKGYSSIHIMCSMATTGLTEQCSRRSTRIHATSSGDPIILFMEMTWKALPTPSWNGRNNYSIRSPFFSQPQLGLILKCLVILDKISSDVNIFDIVLLSKIVSQKSYTELDNFLTPAFLRGILQRVASLLPPLRPLRSRRQNVWQSWRFKSDNSQRFHKPRCPLPPRQVWRRHCHVGRDDGALSSQVNAAVSLPGSSWPTRDGMLSDLASSPRFAGGEWTQLNGLDNTTNKERVRKLELAYRITQNHYNKTSISIQVKIRQYNRVIKPEATYGPECLTMNKKGELRELELTKSHVTWQFRERRGSDQQYTACYPWILIACHWAV